MTIEHVYEKIEERDKEQIRYFLSKGIITENQFLRSLQVSFNVNSDILPIEFKPKLCKFFLVLRFIEILDLNNRKAHKHKELINRLMKKNGFETVNEIICQFVLTSFLKNYKITELFIPGPDGYIDDGIKIPVEIKSRFPKILNLLNKFSIGAKKAWPIINTLDITVEITINKFDSCITKNFIEFEIDRISSFVSQIEFEALPKFPNIGHLMVKQGEMHYEIKFFTRETSITSKFGFSQKQVDSVFMSSISSRAVEGGFGGKTFVGIILNDEMRKIISKTVVLDCIKQIKNMPKEPRILAIYGIPTNKYLEEELDKALENLSKKHEGTCFIAPWAHFNDKMEYELGLHKIYSGARIQESISKYLVKRSNE